MTCPRHTTNENSRSDSVNHNFNKLLFTISRGCVCVCVGGGGGGGVGIMATPFVFSELWWTSIHTMIQSNPSFVRQIRDWQLGCLCNSLLNRTTTHNLNTALLILTDGFLLQSTSNEESISMSLLHDLSATLLLLFTSEIYHSSHRKNYV